MSKKVNKALSPEEQTALSNIQSILSEILAMNEGAEPQSVEMAEPQGMPPTPEQQEEEGKEVKMIIKAFKEMAKKSMEETPSDAATASDDAEVRIDEVQTEQTEENVNEVAKAIMMLLGKNGHVQKSKSSDPTISALNEIVKVVKAQNERQGVLEETLGHIMNGMGVMKQFEVAKAEQKKNQPIVDQDNQAVLKAIGDALGIKATGTSVQKSDYMSNSQVVKKNLGSADVLKGLLGK